MRRAGRGLLITGAVLAVLGIVLAAGALWTVRSDYTTVIPSGGSMEPTYAPGDRIVIAKTSGTKVRRGDVVLFGLPDRFEGKPVLKRVIGLGGDHVVFDGTRLTVDDAPLKEPYLKDGEVDGGHGPYDVKVPAGRMFLLGDHRANSNDSRYFASEDSGTVPVTAVRGRVLDDATAPVLLGLGVLLGVVLALAGAVCTLVGWLTRRRRPAAPSLIAQPLA
ncbi:MULTISPECIES: signal peptidase I [unclassified Streptomyces]|uniref:signal peptidase I n=1 Tax=unclassified Streptomyces TaxID=2593676 RepID=UPI002DD83775|nr:signal peptidase I [Streptomyces sp. NBC_01763]WSC35255.1 signal peptidase I [Streptomyces sp. NBC_01763]WSF88575.1 signal peptidase I [Streptomyces sp. NBC_01744]